MNDPNLDGVAIQFRDVSFRPVDNREILRDLNLEIRRGETLVLLGRSGSGKTTTLKLINRLLDPTEGTVLVDGRPTTAWDVSRLRRMIGYVIQEVGLFPHFTVERNIALVQAGRLVTVDAPDQFLNSTNPLVVAYVDAFRTDVRTSHHRGTS